MVTVHYVYIFSWWQSTSKLLYLILIIQDGDCTIKDFSTGSRVRASCYISFKKYKMATVPYVYIFSWWQSTNEPLYIKF